MSAPTCRATLLLEGGHYYVCHRLAGHEGPHHNRLGPTWTSGGPCGPCRHPSSPCCLHGPASKDRPTTPGGAS